MRSTLRFAFALMLFVLASLAHAQSAQPASLADPYYGSFLPQPGAYYDPAQPGSGVFVDLGPDGTIFAAVFHHDTNGAPSFRTLQGTFIPTYAYPNGPTPQVVRPQPATIGTLRSPLYLTSGGDCLDCGYRPVTTVPDYVAGEAVIEWTTTRRAKMRIGARSWSLQMLNIDRAEADLVVGRWLIAAWAGSSEAAALSTIEIAPAVKPSVSYSLPCCNGQDTIPYPLPSATAKFYRVTCIEKCDRFDAWRDELYGPSSDVFVWFEPSTGLAVLDMWTPSSPELGQTTTDYVATIHRRFYELSLDEDLISGRASYRGQLVFINTNNAVPVQGHLLRMMRLPGSDKRVCAGAAC